jgi:hypothetical protein
MSFCMNEALKNRVFLTVSLGTCPSKLEKWFGDFYSLT